MYFVPRFTEATDIITLESVIYPMRFCVYRLYRAQRLYVQLLSKSMLLAILMGNGIRLQSTIALCPENGFFISYFTRHKGCMSISKKISEHKGCMSISGKSSEHKGCMSTTILCSKRIGRYVIIHDVNSKQDGVEPVGMLRVRPSQEEINNSIRPNNSCGCQNAECFPCYNFTSNQINLGVAFRVREYYMQLNPNY